MTNPLYQGMEGDQNRKLEIVIVPESLFQGEREKSFILAIYTPPPLSFSDLGFSYIHITRYLEEKGRLEK